MDHSEFRMGETFYFYGKKHRCTDIGSRVIIAIDVSEVEVECSDGTRYTLAGDQAEAEGWFNGPT